MPLPALALVLSSLLPGPSTMPPDLPLVRLEGTVQDAAGRGLAGLPLVLEAGGARLRGRTAPGGAFRFTGLLAGEAVLHIGTPAGTEASVVVGLGPRNAGRAAVVLVRGEAGRGPLEATLSGPLPSQGSSRPSPVRTWTSEGGRQGTTRAVAVRRPFQGVASLRPGTRAPEPSRPSPAPPGLRF